MKLRVILVAALAFVPNVSLAAEPCSEKGVFVQVLGSGGPEFVADRAGSSTIVWIKGKARVLIDTGPGSSLRFAKSGASFDDLDVVLWTNLHADHTSDIPAFIQASRSELRSRPLPIFGPVGGRGMPSTIGLVRDLFDSPRGTFRHLGEFISPIDKSNYKLEPHDVRDPKPPLGGRRPPPASPMRVFANDRIRVFATKSNFESAPSVAYRIEVGDRSVVVGADSEGAGIPELVKSANLILAAHAISEKSRRADKGYFLPSRIGELASSANAGQLVLTHRGRETLGREDGTRAAIRRHFSGSIEFADDLNCYRP